MKKLLTVLLAVMMIAGLSACSSDSPQNQQGDVIIETTYYRIGLCNYVDDASLNQICENIETRLNELSDDDYEFRIDYDNANADANVMTQIISNFIADEVDLMIGVATPVAMNMQGMTEDNDIPVIFAAVSDPLAVGLVDALEKPGANITGTSDYLDTAAVMNLIFALNPQISKVGLLYDVSQDSSASSIAQARQILADRGVEVSERTGTTVDEIRLAAQALISDGVEAVFTPSDNTVMTAELSIYEDLAAAGIPHFAGADSFALNGAFVGYGVDYANLGRETADMVYEILINGKDPADVPVRTFDNGIVTINLEIAEALGYDFSKLKEVFAPYSTRVQGIQTAEYFQ